MDHQNLRSEIMLKSKLMKTVSILTCISLIMCMFVVSANALTYKAWETTKTHIDFSYQGSQVTALDSDGNVYNITQNTDTNGKTTSLDYTTNKGGTVSAPVSIVTDPNASLIWSGTQSLFVDANRNVTLFYTTLDVSTYETKLFYVTNKSGSWSAPTMILDSSQFDDFGSVAMDKNGAYHICYFNNNDDLCYISNDGTSNNPVKIYVSASYENFDVSMAEIVVDSNCKSHIAYKLEDEGDLVHPYGGVIEYSTNESGSWSTSIVVASCTISPYTDPLTIALDNYGNVDIAFINENIYNPTYYPYALNSELFFVSNASGTWVKTSVDNTLVNGIQPTIIFDSQNNAHIIYINQSSPPDSSIETPDTKYATNESGSWVTSVFQTGIQYDTASIGNNDRIQLLYEDYSSTFGDTPIMYAYKDTGTSSFIKGDVNSDGNITSADALMVLKYAAGKITLTDTQIQAADVNGSSSVTSADALEILKFAAGKITSFS